MEIRFEGRFGAGDELLDVDLRDLDIHHSAGGRVHLLATTGLNGGVTSYDLGRAGQIPGAAPVVENSVYHSGIGLVGGAPQGLAQLVEIADETRLLLAGGAAGRLLSHGLSSAGALSGQEQIGGAGLAAMGRLAAAVTAEVGGAGGTLYALDQAGDLFGWQLGAGGALGASVAISGAPLLPGALAMVQADLPGGGLALLLADRVTQAVISYRIDPASGALSRVDSFGAAEGLGLAEPTVLESFTAHGKSWALMGAAGSGSLSLLELGRDGSLRLADHLLDTAQTRFGGISALEVVEVGGEALVLAAGSDDGLALFRLLPDGQLVHVRSLAHEAAVGAAGLGLANVTALAATVMGDSLQIFATSGAAAGVSRFSLSLADLGQVADAGGDRLTGSEGDDVLAGGPGAVLSGGDGADIFVLRPGAAGSRSSIRISDFEVGVDQLDLSAFAGLRSLEALGHDSRSGGVVLRHVGPQDTVTEVVVMTRDGQSPTLEALFADGFAFADRMLPPPEAPDPRRVGSAGEDQIRARPAGDQITGLGGDDTLHGDLGRDQLWGGAGRDLLQGAGSADRLFGGTGRDTLQGGSGKDLLQGGGGADRLEGGQGHDRLAGGGGGDRLFGQSGGDQLRGGSGADVLRGGGGADRLWGQGGNDRLFGGAGKDMLAGGGGRDLLVGGGGADVFVFGKGHGHDRIRDFTLDEDLIRLQPGSGVGGFEDLILTQQGDDLRITTPQGQIWLEDISAAQISADDFLF